MTASGFIDDILIRANRGMGRTSVGGGAKPRAERVWKSLTSTGSAFVKRIPGAGVQHSKQLAGQLAYVNGKAKGTFGFATGISAEGDAFEQGDLDQLMNAWSQDWKGRPRNGHTSHMVLSFPDDVSQDAAFMIAQEWCAEMFEDETHVSDSWEYVAALHTDTTNPHVHIILNNRGQGGTWFSISSEGIFNPQMMRDRMTDIADDYGIRLESLSRADRGLYGKPITSEEIHAKREGRTLSTEAVEADITADWRRNDMLRTAQLYSTLADFALTIGAPMIANRAYISAAALFAGEEIPKGQMMGIELDVNADREDIRTSLIGWAEQNREQIEALPEGERAEIMGKIDAALNIIETDVTPDLTDDTIWTAFKNTPSSYLIPNVGALEARAALYVDEADTALLHEFVNENVLDTYLVTGEVPSKFAAVMPAVADAYEEMHSHRLEEIPKEMKAYVQKAASMGIDPLQMQERLINAIDDPVENVKMEREDIAKIVAARGATVLENGVRDIERNDIQAAFNRQEWNAGYKFAEDSEAYEKANDELNAFKPKVAEFASKSNSHAAVASDMWDRYAGDREPFAGYLTDEERERVAAELKARSSDDYSLTNTAKEHGGSVVDGFDRTEATPKDASEYVAAYRKAEADYRDLQLELGNVEERIIADSKVYNRDGVARVLQDVASTAATTGRADLADSAVGRHVLTAFVALEGRGAMQEIASGNVDSLSEYIDTPANQRLAAKELLKSAKSVDVGLGQDEIETGLEAVDPNYSRGRGHSI
tara:strand:- start:21717 stop:24023 length:2307 start_codon:yes stop_codon:yes gene_type:complete